MSELIVDGFDTAALGLTLHSDVSGWRDMLAASWPAQAVPGRIGELLTASRPTYAPRPLRVAATQRGSTVGELQDFLDELKSRLRPGQHEIGLPDRADRIFRVRIEGGIQVDPVDPAYVATWHRLRIPMTCHDPRILAAADSVVSVATAAGAVAIPLGSAPSSPQIEVDQATFTLTLRDRTGAVLATFGVTGASASPVTVDMAARTVTSSGGSEVDAIDAGSSFFDLDPAGGFPSSDWPTLEVSAGTATVTYRKAWL